MRARIWEDPAAMGVVSVLGFLMNDEGEVVGPERTQVLCKLMPSIHTLTHRAILAMLIAGLSDADAQTFYAEKGLKVLNAWLQDGLNRKKEPGMSKEKRRVEMFSQVRALLRIMDVSVQTDAARKLNSYIAPTLPKAIELLDNAGPDYSAEWSKLNIYRRHFESSCGTVSTFREARSEPVAKRPRSQASPVSTPSPAATTNGSSSSTTRPGSAGSLPRTSSFTSGTTSTPTSTPAPTSVRTTASRPASASTAASVLQYQPKSFLQQDNNASKQDDEMDEFVDDDDDDMLTGAGFITNVGQPTINASLDKKIRNNGHSMQYINRTPCRVCKRMGSKRCEYCDVCLKCAQREKCLSLTAPPRVEPSSTAPSPGETNGTPSPKTTATTTTSGAPAAPAPRSGPMTAEERTKQVLGSAMDKAIYGAFRYEDFHTPFSLVSNGMDVNFQRVESDNSTVLMAAAHHGRDDAVKKLLELGANPCLIAKDGRLAWMFAENRGHTALTEELKKRTEEWEAKHSANTDQSAS